MEIKVNCSCGQRYAFDVEPVDGQMPVEITCPSCNASGTEQSNTLIREKLAAEPQVRVPTPVVTIPSVNIPKVTVPNVSVPSPASAPPRRATLPSSMGTPKPPAPSAAPPPAPAPTAVTPAPATLGGGPSKLLLSRGPGGHAPPPPPPSGDAPVEDSAALMAAPPPTAASKPAIPRKVEKVFGEPNLVKSIIGASIGAALMTAIWFGLWKGTGGNWGIMAVAVGWMAGFFARFIGRSEGSKMGMATVAVAMVFIFGFQGYRASVIVSSLRSDTKEVDRAFELEQGKAKELLKAIPTGSDAEIRAHLAGKDGNPADPKDISAETVEVFRKIELKDARETAKKTKEANRAEIKKFEDQVADSWPVRIMFWVNAIGIFSIVSILIGLGAAYRFGSGEG